MNRFFLPIRYLFRPTILLALGFLSLYVFWVADVNAETSEENPEHYEWATPIELEGVPNLHKVSEDVYRGAQPTAEGMQALKDLGVKTIINLRSLHSDRDEIGEIDLDYEHIPMLAFFPSDDEILHVLDLMTDETRTPAFVHCMHGADRTGVVSAMYRIIIQDWPKDEAIREMTEGGFGFHSIFRNLVEHLEHLDVEKFQQKFEEKSERKALEEESEADDK